MKPIYIALCIMALIAATTAQLNDTNSTKDETIIPIFAIANHTNTSENIISGFNTTNPTLVTPIIITIPNNISNNINYTVLHLFNETKPNATSYNETFNQYTIPTTTDTLASTTESATTTIITDSTTTTTYTTTTTIAAICGNKIQEHDEACDGSIASCGSGRWKCVDCKCIPLPLEQSTTTSIIISNLSTVENISSDTQNNKIIATTAAIITALIIIASVLYNEGKKEENENREHKI
jgi:hypothetical protein